MFQYLGQVKFAGEEQSINMYQHDAKFLHFTLKDYFNKLFFNIKNYMSIGLFLWFSVSNSYDLQNGNVCQDQYYSSSWIPNIMLSQVTDVMMAIMFWENNHMSSVSSSSSRWSLTTTSTATAATATAVVSHQSLCFAGPNIHTWLNIWERRRVSRRDCVHVWSLSCRTSVSTVKMRPLHQWAAR